MSYRRKTECKSKVSHASPNQYWDAIHEILGQRIVKHLQSEKIWIFNYFRLKITAGKISAAKNFGPSQLQRYQRS